MRFLLQAPLLTVLYASPKEVLPPIANEPNRTDTVDTTQPE
ncbi:MAG: hypothetical protein ACRCWR_02750 [Saezia sp.]